MNSAELGEVVRGRAKLVARIKELEAEVAERQAELKTLNAQLREQPTTGRVKVTAGVCASVKDLAQRGYAYREIAKLMAIGLTTVSLIVSNKYKTQRLEKPHGGV